MDTLRQDIRFALRSLRRTPGFTIAVIAVMGLGIGVNALVYTVVRGVLFADLPFPEPHRVFQIEAVNRREPGSHVEMSLPDVRDVASQVRSLTGTTGYFTWSAIVAGGDAPEVRNATSASSGLAEALAVPAQRGRWFTPAECRLGPNLVPVVLGDRAWRERFHGDPQVLGRTLVINGRARTVVGVMPPGFRFPEASDYYLPLAMDDTTQSRGSHYLGTVARLVPGRTPAQARAELAALARRLEREYHQTNDQMSLVAVDYPESLVRGLRPLLVMLTLAVTFVLLIACANVANLLLARATARRREMGVRIALGAGRGRLLRQMLTESLLLSLAGGALGVLLGEWGLRLALAAIPVPLPYWMHLGLDPRVLAAVVAASVLAGLAFGLAPALHTTSGDLLTPLREGTPGGGDSPAHRRMRNALVVSEIALSIVLLVGSGLMIRSFLRQREQRSALRTDGVLTGSVTLPFALYPGEAERTAFFRDFGEGLRGLPGVHAAGGAVNLHLGTNQWRTSVQREGVDGEDASDNRNPAIGLNIITPGYLEAVGLRLLRGRAFSDADGPNAPRVALVNDLAARRLWPGQDPLGKRLHDGRDDDKGWITVVGVVASVGQTTFSPGERVAELLEPHAQFPNQTLVWAIRGDGPVEARLAAVRRLLHAKDPNLAFGDARSLEDNIRLAMWEPRVFAQLMGVFSCVALIIAALGIYGVMAYAVSQRTREIGIRMALGAAREDVQRLVLGQALRLTLLGSGAGLALAFGLTRFMQNQLFGVRPDDPPTFVGVTLILALSSAAAAWLPIARAVRVDPVVALRHE